MTNSDEVVLLSQFKYDLFEANPSFIKGTYFLEDSKIKGLDLFQTLINGQDGKYYRSNYITNKILFIIEESTFIDRFSKEDQIKIFLLIKSLIKNNQDLLVGQDKLLMYRQKVIREYFVIQKVLADQKETVFDSKLLNLFNEFLYDYVGVFLKDDLLLGKFQKYLAICTKEK